MYSSLVYVYSQIAGAVYRSQIVLPYQGLSRPVSVFFSLLFFVVTIRSLAIKNIFHYLVNLPAAQFYFLLFIVARMIVFASSLNNLILGFTSLLISISLLIICNRIRELPPDEYRNLKNRIIVLFCSTVIIFTLFVYLFTSENAISWRDRYFFFFDHPNQAALTFAGVIAFLVPILKDNLSRLAHFFRNKYLTVLNLLIFINCFFLLFYYTDWIA